MFEEKLSACPVETQGERRKSIVEAYQKAFAHGDGGQWLLKKDVKLKQIVNGLITLRVLGDHGDFAVPRSAEKWVGQPCGGFGELTQQPAVTDEGWRGERTDFDISSAGTERGNVLFGNNNSGDIAPREDIARQISLMHESSGQIDCIGEHKETVCRTGYGQCLVLLFVPGKPFLECFDLFLNDFCLNPVGGQRLIVAQTILPQL